MLRIGEFSILSSISIHMLRHYDEIGLLTPDHVDEFTGYRYYREDQLAIANQILALKNMGFGLKAIAQIQNQKPTDEQIRYLLKEKAREKETEIKTLQIQLQHLNNVISELESKNEYTGHIAVKEIPKRQVVSYRTKVTEFSQEGNLWTALYEECQKLELGFSNTGYNIAVLHEINEVEHWVDIEVQKTADRCFGKSEIIEFKIVEAIKVASLVFQGGYSKLKDVNAYVAKWILENHYEISGNLFNIYHVSPECSLCENEFITEVCFPIKERMNV